MYLSILLTIVAILVTIYYYCSSRLNHFKIHGIDHMKPWPIIGNSLALMLKRISVAEYIENLYNINKEAKYVGYYEFMSPLVVIRDPELIKSIGVKNFDSFTDHRVFITDDIDPLFGKNLFMLRGDKWKSTRTLLSPAFTSSKMKSMFKLMQKCGQDFGKFMSNEIPKEGKEIEVKDVFTRYTNDVIATCAFGISVDSMKDPNNEFYLVGKKATNLDRPFQMLKFICIRFFPFMKNLISLTFIDEQCGKYFKNVIQTTIKTRDEKNIRRPDMIQLMMDSRGKREEGDFTLDDMTAQGFIFFFAGFESTANSMSFVAHELAVNQEIQVKLQIEIDDVIERSNGQPGYEDINAMKYLEAVIYESLRLYPVVAQLDRACVKSFQLPPPTPGGKPYVVEKDATVLFPTYALHRDPKYFKDPLRFNPNRFLEENNDNNMSAYLPFGLGPRICIANRFALLETKVLIFQLFSQLSLKPCSRTNVPMKFNKNSFIMTSDNGFWVKAEPRKEK